MVFIKEKNVGISMVVIWTLFFVVFVCHWLLFLYNWGIFFVEPHKPYVFEWGSGKHGVHTYIHVDVEHI